MGPSTRVITFSDVSNVSGLKLPVREISNAAHERGIYVHVDGAQSLGSMPVNLHELGCDSYAASMHKWLMGPKEVGILYVRADRIEGLWPALVSQDWGDGIETVMEGARKYECLGQRNDALIAGIVPSLDYHAGIGADVIYSRIRELASLMKEGLVGIPGINLVTPKTPDMSAGVVVFNFPGRDNRVIYDTLYDQERIAASTKGGIRLCPHIYNTRSEIELVVAAVERATARLA
jgi:selenocysteine lyase/cysteine desulfurase